MKKVGRVRSQMSCVSMPGSLDFSLYILRIQSRPPGRRAIGRNLGTEVKETGSKGNSWVAVIQRERG